MRAEHATYGDQSTEEHDAAMAVLAEAGAVVRLPSPLEPLSSTVVDSTGCHTLYVKRDDLISPLFPGNKFRKLLPHIARVAATDRPKRIATFGGAFSNHLYAFASLCRLLEVQGVALVRGERVEPLNPVLEFVETSGVTLHFLDRETYRHRRQSDLQRRLRDSLNLDYLIPEGGTDEAAVVAVGDVIRELSVVPDVVVTAVGTGGTIAGLSRAAHGDTTVLGFSALKGATSLDDDIAQLTPRRNWLLDHAHHFGGFARTTPELWAFIEAFEEETSIRLDATYTAKALVGLRDHLQSEAHPITAVFLHTGGIPIDTRNSLLQKRR